jgi:hypothetical protein
MKFLLSVVAVVAVAAGFSLFFAADADAGGCLTGWRCNAAVLVPAPNPIPLRRLRRPRVVAAAPVAVAPAPCVAPCGLPPGPTAYRYRAPNYYAYYKQPAYAGECGLSTCNTYWRRDCWYDSFGRRFCN